MTPSSEEKQLNLLRSGWDENIITTSDVSVKCPYHC